MTESKRIAHSSFALLTGRFSSSLLNIGFTVFFAHQLTKIQFATLAVFEILGALTNMISNFGLETYCMREIPGLIENKDISRASQFIKTAITSRLLWSSITGFLLIFFKQEIALIFFKDESYARSIQIISLGAVFFSMNTSMGLIASSLKLFKEIALINFIITLAFCTASITLYYFVGYIGWVIGFSISRAIGCILFFLLLKKWFFASMMFYPWTKMVRKSIPFYLRGFVKFGLLKLDQIVIGIFMTPGSLSMYYVAKKFPFYVSIIIESMGSPLLVRISEYKDHGKSDIQKMLTKISRYNSFIFIPLCIGIATFGFPLLEIYGGSKYIGGFIILVVLSLARMIKGLTYSVYENGLFIYGEPHKILIVDLVGCLSSLIFLIMLVPFFGALGVALSVLVSTACAQFSARYMLNNIFHVQFDTKAIYTVLFAMGGFVMIGVVAQAIHYKLYLAPFYLALSSFVFIFIMCNLIDSNEIKFIVSLIPKGDKYVLPFLNGLKINKNGCCK